MLLSAHNLPPACVLPAAEKNTPQANPSISEEAVKAEAEAPAKVQVAATA
jgi:hypothetical protein